MEDTLTRPDVVLFELSNYIRPKLQENKFRDWVLNGRNNSFYGYIIDRYNGSPTNAAIINSYVDLIYGQGLSAKNTLNPDWLKLKAILKPKDIKRIVSDFELYGEACFEIIQTKGKKLSSISHIPKEKVAPSIAKDNVIESYWICNDWGKIAQNPPLQVDAFSGKHAKEIFVIRPYKAGKDYFSDPDYLAGMPYAEMEEEIANLNINSIKNGLSAGYIINVPDGKALSPEEKDAFEQLIKQKLTGSPNASRFILSFNGRDAEITITPFPVNENVHKQWEFLTGEARQQLLTAHRVTSPMLFGIKDNTGLGNNADELDTAEAQLMKRVVKPKQNYITEALEEVLEAYGMSLDLHFIPLTEKVSSPTQLRSHKEDVLTKLADQLIDKGEVLDESWVLLTSNEVDYDTDDEVYKIQLASTGTARPNAKSVQDSKDIKILYRYTGHPSPQREFCQKMMMADKLYRKEDIVMMGSQAVNPGFGMDGADTYDIWLYKGGGKLSDNYPGGTCRHKWYREIYLKVDGEIDVNSPLAKKITTTEAKSRGYKVPVNEQLVPVAPHDNR
ncbi:MAG TPA: hypothetical protein VJ945_03460 [Flavobacteriaceae bacterium]|nr:hypothetical protein [Flavobacteriaceae bacterium]